MEPIKAFKVVKFYKGKYYSAWANGFNQVEYKVDVPAYPVNPDRSRLFVFDNVISAWNWFHDRGGNVRGTSNYYTIWEAEVTGIESDLYSVTTCSNQDDITSFLKGEYGPKREISLPRGTMAVQTVTLKIPYNIY
jgi:hypothetical protein